ncbi:hypothetical protein CDIFJ21_33820 [Clostridioides difficile]|nr:hypothetical protein CDIFJ21_33820 [Clostridioides difficile]
MSRNKYFGPFDDNDYNNGYDKYDDCNNGRDDYNSCDCHHCCPPSCVGPTYLMDLRGRTYLIDPTDSTDSGVGATGST